MCRPLLDQRVRQEQQQRKQLAIVGAGGRLGAALARVYRADHEVRAFTRAQLGLAAPDRLRESLGGIDFDVLINCAAQTNVDRCETQQEEAFTINGEAPGVLAEICSGKGARLIHISTDYVFDGEKREPYTENDAPNPISVYGASKLEGERRVLAVSGDHLVVRVSWVFGPDRPSFVDWIVDRAREQDHVEAVADKFSTPTYTLDIAEMLRPFISGERIGGLLHLANTGECSWREYGQYALDCCVKEGVPLRATSVGAITLADMKNFIARRPVHTVMATSKYERSTGGTPRSWQDAVAEYVRDHIAPRAQV
jgi:dTDP-4-dehydrorhamnose reductase